MTAPTTGPLAGRYTISRKIADGGMAEIFLATQLGAEGFERPVILKRILPALSADPQFRHMLVDEAHIAMSLSHSNIVQVVDLGESEGRTFLVLELVDGWDLEALLTRSKLATHPLPDGLALYIVASVCRALSYAHSKTRGGRPMAVIHRDVSPQNVLVSEQGEVKLTDFGIAKAFGRREQTRAGVIKGKLAFMSPEQAAGAPLDARSDIFSVGSLLYTMVTGARPFSAPSDLEALLCVQRAEYTPPETVRPNLPPAIATLMARAMKKLPSERFRSAEEMLLAIEETLRSGFGGMGQSELKRWLADLYKRDEEPPTSRAEALPVAAGSDALPGRTVALGAPKPPDPADELVNIADSFGGGTQSNGQVVVQTDDEEELTEDTFMDLHQPVHEPPVALADTLQFGARPGGQTVLPPALRAPAPPALRVVTPPQMPLVAHATKPSEPPHPPEPVVRPLATPVAGAPLRLVPPTPSLPSTAARPPRRKTPVVLGVGLVAALAAGGVWMAQPAFLKHTALDKGEEVTSVDLGKDPTPVAAEEAKAPERTGLEPRLSNEPPVELPSAPAKEPPRPAPTSVQVRFESRPSGAVVKRARSRGKPLGRTPFDRSFPIGVTFDVVFTKPGYAAERRTVVASGSRAEVRATLDRPKKKRRGRK